MFERRITTISFEGPLVRLMSTRGDRVEQWTELPLPAEAVGDGSLIEPAVVGDLLKQRLQADKYPRRNIVASIPGHRSIIRTIRLPAIEAELLAGAVERKVRQEIPMPPGEMDLAWQTIERTEDELRLFVVATPRRIIDSHVRALQAAGLRPKALDINALAMVSSANRTEAIIANLENDGITVVIVWQGMPAIVRTAPLTGPAATDEARLEVLAQEITRTTKFYNESRRDLPLPEETAIVATGAGLADRSQIERLASRVSYRVILPNPPMDYPQDFPLASYAVNLGLAQKLL